MPESGPIYVLGAGRMGRGIAQCYALAGTDAVLIDLKARPDGERKKLAQAVQTEIGKDLEFAASLDLIPSSRVADVLARIKTLSADDAADEISAASLVFEGVPEVLEVKQAALSWVSEHASADTVVASTTSTLDVNELAGFVTHPGRFLNAHWLNPAHLMPLVEMSAGSATSKGTIEAVRTSLRDIGKVPVVCSASPGYIVPRIQALAMNEAARLVEEGVASAEDVDTAVRVGFGLRFAVLGLLEFIDWGGNDILYYASRHMSRTVDAARYRAPDIVQQNMHEGRNGVRDGVGFYDYRDRDVDAYRRKRLEQFIGLLDHLDLLPAGLDRTNSRDGESD